MEIKVTTDTIVRRESILPIHLSGDAHGRNNLYCRITHVVGGNSDHPAKGGAQWQSRAARLLRLFTCRPAAAREPHAPSGAGSASLHIAHHEPASPISQEKDLPPLPHEIKNRKNIALPPIPRTATVTHAKQPSSETGTRKREINAIDDWVNFYSDWLAENENIKATQQATRSAHEIERVDSGYQRKNHSDTRTIASLDKQGTGWRDESFVQSPRMPTRRPSIASPRQETAGVSSAGNAGDMSERVSNAKMYPNEEMAESRKKYGPQDAAGKKEIQRNSLALPAKEKTDFAFAGKTMI